jgi:predicted ATPase
MIGSVLQNRYRLDAELGHGGMGVVYRARDGLLDREVAVKVLSAAGLSDDARARLLREARAAAHLNHPNIVTIYDAGEFEGAPFIVMELVNGVSLHDLQTLTLPDILDLTRQLCAALDHAHSHGIVHRDLKPENILVVSNPPPNPSPSEGERGVRVKLMDFGLARSRGAARLTQEGALVGSVYYLPPEQALGQEVDGRADLYSLGVIIYELTTGRLPFTGDDPLTIISQHLYAPVVPPRTFRPELPPALEASILKLLAKNPADRFPSARELEHALDSVPEDEPAPVGAPSGTTDTVALLEQLARGRLIGRQRELNQLRELWNRAQYGQGHLALLSGEPGVGKTRLAHEVMLYARLNGAMVLQGGCYEYEAATPYLPFVEALREWVHAQGADELREHLGATGPELAKLAPEIESKLGALTPNPTLSPNEERLRLFDNVARFLQTLAGEHGLLLFIDDLHWADQGTLGLLHYLLRNLRSERLLILGAYRGVELDRMHPLSAALVEWNRERLATRVSLGRLSLDDTGTLLAALFGQASVSREFAEVLFRETEGNPFFIEEVVKSLIEQGQIYREDGRWGRKEITELAIPQSVKEAIGRRLNRLSPGSTDVLHIAAALGKIFSFGELAAVIGTGVQPPSRQENEMLDALDEAIAAQLIQSERDEQFSFTHDKIREVLYEELNPIRRRRLHQRIGEGLEELYAPNLAEHVQDLAHHFAESGDLAKGLRYSLMAAEKTRNLFAHDDALHYYEHARESAEALNVPEELAGIYEAIGEIYSLRGPVSQAVANYERAVALAPTREKRGALKAKIGRDYASVGDARGHQSIQEALEDLDPGTQTNQVATAMAMLGRYHHYHAQHSQAIAYLERARELAEPLDDAPTLSSIYAYLAGAHQHLARFSVSMEWARKAIALGARKNHPSAEAAGCEFIAEDSAATGRWQDSLDYAARDRQIGEKIGAQDRIAWAEFSRSWALHGLGDLPAAVAAARLAVTLSEKVGDARLAIMAKALLAIVQTDLGADLEALSIGQLAVAQADELRHVVIQTNARRSLAYLYLERQDWEHALQLYQQCLDLITPTENRWEPLMFGSNLAEALCGMGHLDQAASLISDNLHLTREAQSRHWEGIALRVQGQTLAAQQDCEGARRAFDAAISTFEDLGSRLELGRAQYHRGAMWHKCGNPKAARDDLARAQTVFKEIGAPRDLSRAEETLGPPGAASTIDRISQN